MNGVKEYVAEESGVELFPAEVVEELLEQRYDNTSHHQRDSNYLAVGTVDKHQAGCHVPSSNYWPLSAYCTKLLLLIN